MSRIFDALRKAEKQKKPPAPPEKADTRLVVDSTSLEGVPEEFVTEMGSLRNNIEASITKPRGKIILLTSSVKGEGTTTVTYYLARILAADPEVKVVVLDANLRNPSLHEFFGEDGGKGMLDVLGGTLKWRDAVKKTRWANLDFLPAGSAEAFSTLSVTRLSELLRSLSTEYTHLVIDTGAVLSSPEATGFFSEADGILLIIQSLRTKREVVAKAVDIIRKSRGKILGAFLNKRKYYIPEFIYKRV